MSDPARLYDADFFRWTQEQAALLRQVHGERVNLPIDWNHAAEEIEDMGRSDLRAANNRIGVILEHLLKLEHCPVGNPREGWVETVCSMPWRCIENSGRQPEHAAQASREVAEGVFARPA